MMEGSAMLDLNKRQAIDKRVDELLSAYGYDPKVDDRLDIVAFAQNHGYAIGNARLDKSEHGFIIIRPDCPEGDRVGPKAIGVNARQDVPFKRFVIAHELGHGTMHYENQKLFLHRDSKREKPPKEKLIEEEADYFAAALLLPRVSFRRQYDNLKKSGIPHGRACIKLAEIFKVPLESVLRRCDELEIA